MAAVLTGTPVFIDWGTGANPAGQSITIPADCTEVDEFWRYYSSSSADLVAATLNGVSYSQVYTEPGNGTQDGRGVIGWYNPATGSQTLDVEWANDPSTNLAPTMVAFVKDGDLTAWRDADAAFAPDVGPVSVTLTTVAGDLVIKNDTSAGSAPSLSAGWTSGLTATLNSLPARLSYIDATGSSQVCDCEDDFYSTIVAISIPAAAPPVAGKVIDYSKFPIEKLAAGPRGLLQ